MMCEVSININYRHFDTIQLFPDRKIESGKWKGGYWWNISFDPKNLTLIHCKLQLKPLIFYEDENSI